MLFNIPGLLPLSPLRRGEVCSFQYCYFSLTELDLLSEYEYIDFAIKIDKSKLTIQQSLDKLEVLKKALMQQYFG